MIEIINPSQDPYFNLALEEYVLMQMAPHQKYFFLWQDQPTVVVGRNQNTIEEINQPVVKAKDIRVARRLSGGGAVYHDLGNLNFTFIVDEDNQPGFDFKKFTRPIIKTLAKIGIMALDNGRNDITIDGKKFSGNAQFKYRNRLLHHGTILVNTCREDMEAVLQVGEDKIASKGVKSVRSRVTNINDHLKVPVSMEYFKQVLTETIIEEENDIYKYDLSREDLEQIEQLKENKYSTWKWNYGASPQFNIRKTAKLDWGKIDFHLEVKKGEIKECKIFGDFFAGQEISGLESQLTGVLYNDEAIRQAFRAIDLTRYLPQANTEEILSILTA